MKMIITVLTHITSQDLVTIITQITIGIHIMTHIGVGIMDGLGILVGILAIVTIRGTHHGITHITDIVIGDTLHIIGVAGIMAIGMVTTMVGTMLGGTAITIIMMAMPEISAKHTMDTEPLQAEMGHHLPVVFQKTTTLRLIKII